MKLAVVGTGYVGLTAGVCFAESGNEVVGVDVDGAKVAMLTEGRVPIYEPGLAELLVRNLHAGRLRFTTQLAEAVRECPLLFVAVGTPPGEDGEADISVLEGVCREIVRTMPDRRTIVIKSTVPVGTNGRLTRELSALTDKPFDLASNPEFLKEGYAVDDFLRPDRVIVGTTSPTVAELLQELYAPFVRNNMPIIVMDPASAEMTKYAANAMLSTKISFINEIANLCERLGADINDVRRGICSDSRIGYQFLYPGLGFGGSCFPKDIAALVHMCERTGYPGHLLRAVREVNEYQRRALQRKIREHFGSDLSGRRFAIWGLSFKPRTDDIRESPALSLIADLLAAGAAMAVHDPQAMDNVRQLFGEERPDGRIRYCPLMYDALRGADALCVVTEWNEYRNPDYERMRSLMTGDAIFDGRNLYDPQKMASLGLRYYGIGRKQLPQAR